MADEPTDPGSDETTDLADADGALDEGGEAVDADEASGSSDGADPSPEPAEAGTAPKAGAPVVRRKVVSKRVTPKGGGPVKPSGRGSTAAHAHAADGDDASYSTRYTPPTAKYAPGPSPWWVPALMFGMLIIGALVIMLNYMGVFGDADNIRLIIGLAFILGGIITATQLR